jgi:DNA-binding NtrC family response regulator
MLESTKILVMDDNDPDLEFLITQTFRKKILLGELEFCFAHNGEEATELLHKNQEIGVVLTSGALDLLRGTPPVKRPIKTIVITPCGDIESIRTAMNKGAFYFVTRPINLQ